MSKIKYFIISIILIPAYFISLNAQYIDPNTGNIDASDKITKKPGFLETFLSTAPLVKKGKDDKKWFITIGGWVENKSGNTESMRSNGEISLKYDNNITSFSMASKIFYGSLKNNETDKFEVNENNGNAILKLDHYIYSRVEFFIFSQVEYDEMALLSLRNNSGAGAKFIFFRNKYWKTDISGAPIFQYEKFEDQSSTKDARLSFRFRTKITPVKAIKLNFTYFYVPKMTSFTTYRSSIDTFLELTLADLTWTKKSSISMKIGFLQKYNKEAIAGTEPTDETLYFKLLINL